MGQHNDATYPIALNVQLIVGEIKVEVMGCCRASNGLETYLALSIFLCCEMSHKLKSNDVTF